MKLKLLLTLLVVGNLRNLTVSLLLIFFPAFIDLILLLLGETIVHLLRDLELECKGYAGLFGWCLGIRQWIVDVCKGDGSLLPLPTREDDRTEGGRPSIRAKRLNWREFPLVLDVEFQITSNLRRLRPTTGAGAEPVFDLLYTDGVSTIVAR